MKNLHIALALMFIVAALLLGCNEAQKLKADRLATGSRTVGQDIEGFLQTPTGTALPGELRFVLAMAGLVASGAGNAWLGFRNGKYRQTLLDIVASNDDLKTANAPTKKAVAAARHELE